MRLAIGVLAAVAFWPVAHRVWVAQSGVSPWKFFGWAMYCEPRFRSQLEFRALRRAPDEQAGSIQQVGSIEKGEPVRYPRRRLDALRALVAYRSAELAWLRQTDPEDLAKAVFAAYPKLHHLALHRHWTRYDVDLAMPVVETEVLYFGRPAAGDGRR